MTAAGASTAATPRQVAAIPAEAKRLGIGEAARRDLVAAHGGGKRLSRELTGAVGAKGAEPQLE